MIKSISQYVKLKIIFCTLATVTKICRPQ